MMVQGEDDLVIFWLLCFFFANVFFLCIDVFCVLFFQAFLFGVIFFLWCLVIAGVLCLSVYFSFAGVFALVFSLC